MSQLLRAFRQLWVGDRVEPPGKETRGALDEMPAGALCSGIDLARASHQNYVDIARFCELLKVLHQPLNYFTGVLLASAVSSADERQRESCLAPAASPGVAGLGLHRCLLHVVSDDRFKVRKVGGVARPKIGRAHV